MTCIGPCSVDTHPEIHRGSSRLHIPECARVCRTCACLASNVGGKRGAEVQVEEKIWFSRSFSLLT